jgi:hypothetical protein
MAALMWTGWPAAAREPAPAQVKAEAETYFNDTVKWMYFIATDKGSRGYDDTSVRMLRGTYIKSGPQDGCRLTIANAKAALGDPRNGTHREGPATITIDWGFIIEIDDAHVHADQMETGFLLRGGIDTSLGTRPALRIMGTVAREWAFLAKKLQRVCSKKTPISR